MKLSARHLARTWLSGVVACACLAAAPHAARAQLRPSSDELAGIGDAAADFCQSALLDGTGSAAVLSGNTKVRLSRIVARFGATGTGRATATLDSTAAMRGLQDAATRIVATSRRCEQDLAGLLARTLFPDAGPNDAPAPPAILAGRYAGSVANTTLMTHGTILLDVTDGSRTIHLHTHIVTINDADLEVAQSGGAEIDASGPMHTSNNRDFVCRLLARRYGKPGEATMLKGSFEITPMSPGGFRQRYDFEAKASTSVSASP